MQISPIWDRPDCARTGVSQTTYSVAADFDNDEVFVPVVGAGIQV